MFFGKSSLILVISGLFSFKIVFLRCFLPTIKNIYYLCVLFNLKNYTMGTNYYAMRIPTVEEYENLVGLVYGKDGAANIFLEVASFTAPFLEQIHIGKSSGGWTFLFDHNNWEYYKDLEELKHFLKTHRIVDEYSRDHQFDEFWDFVLKEQADPNNKIHDYDCVHFGFAFCSSTGFF